MKKHFQFTIRDFFWLMVVLAVFFSWMVDVRHNTRLSMNGWQAKIIHALLGDH